MLSLAYFPTTARTCSHKDMGAPSCKQREGDARLLVPVVPTLSKAEVVKVLPTLVCKLPSAELKQSLASMYRPDALSPVELMVALHALDPARDQVPLKKVGGVLGGRDVSCAVASVRRSCSPMSERRRVPIPR